MSVWRCVFSCFRAANQSWRLCFHERLRSFVFRDQHLLVIRWKIRAQSWREGKSPCICLEPIAVVWILKLTTLGTSGDSLLDPGISFFTMNTKDSENSDTYPRGFASTPALTKHVSCYMVTRKDSLQAHMKLSFLILLDVLGSEGFWKGNITYSVGLWSKNRNLIWLLMWLPL